MKEGLTAPSLTARAAAPLLVISVVLTAAAIPLSVILLEHQHGAALPAAAAISVMAVLGSFLFSMYTHLKTFGERGMTFSRRDDYIVQLSSARPYARQLSAPMAVRKSATVTGRMVALLSESDTLAEQLLAEFEAIECTARDLLGTGRRISVIRIRLRLLELGIWSERDVCDFDDALRVRSKVARADIRPPTPRALAEAMDTLQRLHLKMLYSEHRPSGGRRPGTRRGSDGDNE